MEGPGWPDAIPLPSLPRILLRLPIGQAQSEDGGRDMPAFKGKVKGGESDLEESGLHTLVGSPGALLRIFGAITVSKT